MVRFKHRYLLVSLVFPSTLSNPLATTPVVPVEKSPFINESGLISLLRDSLSVNFGDVGAGEVGGSFSIKYMSPQTHIVIIRVARDHYRTLWAALTLLRRLGGLEVIARVLHVSGTIRKTQHAAIALDRSILLESAAKVAQMLDVEQAVELESPAGEKEETTLQAELRKNLDEHAQSPSASQSGSRSPSQAQQISYDCKVGLPDQESQDISNTVVGGFASFTDAERELFQKYGKVPAHKNLLSNKLKERKYFDSGDYAMSKAGVSPQHNVGTAIPSPSDIPHSNPSTSPSSSGGIGIPSTSPTNTSTPGHATGMGTSPGKEGGLGTGRENNLTFGRQ